jgi:spermidine synthase
VKRSALALLCLASTLAFARGPVVLFDGPSKVNGRVIVTEESGVRTLRFSPDGSPQTRMRVSAPRQLVQPYTRAAMRALELVPQPKRILIVGLGGGAMAMFLRERFPSAEIDGVEIDPVVVSAAKKHFGLVTDEKLRAIVADGRKFLEGAKPGYDLIFLDAYAGEDPPAHLMTVEFLAAVRARLSPGGVAVANVGDASENTDYANVVRTWQAAFDALCVQAVAETANTIFLARADGKRVSLGCLGQPSDGEVLRD